MTPEQREQNRRAFEEKNRRRRLCKKQGARTQAGLRARAMRKAQQVPGAFGRLPSSIFNKYAEGTTGYRTYESTPEQLEGEQA